MRRHRLLSFLAVAAGLAALLYVAISLFIPSPRRMILGVDKRTGEVRMVENRVGYLPPHRFYRLVFDMNQGAAQRDGVVTLRSAEGVPVKLTYRLRFRVDERGLRDPKRLVEQGWTAWVHARIGEAVSAVTQRIPVDSLITPISEFAGRRERLRRVVVSQLARNGLEVTAFEILKLEVDREALLEYKRAQLRRNARGYRGSVALFAIDGADWDLIDDLVDDGVMPNLERMIEAGTTGRLQTIQPTIPPLLYTTMATGLPPDRTGVVDFFDPLTNAPIDARARRVPAVWDIAAAFKRSAGVVNWWTAWPPTTMSGFFFDHPGTFSAWVHPEEHQRRVNEVVVPDSTVGHDQVARFVNVSAKEYQSAIATRQNADPVAMLRAQLAKTWSDHRAAIELYRLERPELLLFNFSAADFVNHMFGPYRPPYREDVPWEEYRRYWPAVGAFYGEVDRMLGEWMEVIPDETTVMIVSPHGMVWGKNRPKRAPRGELTLSDHAGAGIFVASGSQVAPSGLRRELSIYDVTPTLLTLLGLPKSQEMPGSFAAWAFREVEPVTAVDIASYGDIVEFRQVSPDKQLAFDLYRERLLMVGHVPDPERRTAEAAEERESPAPEGVSPEQWARYAWHNNEGVRLKREGKAEEAVSRFREAIAVNQDRPIPYLNLAMALFDIDRYTAAEEAFFQAIERGLPNGEQYLLDFAALYRSEEMPLRAAQLLSRGLDYYPDSWSVSANLGSALAAADRLTDALPHLQRALGLRPTATVVLNDLGMLYYQQRDYARALDYWNRSLAVDQRQPEIRAAINAVQSRI